MEKKDKYKLIAPKYKKEMKQIKDLKYQEENAYTSDLDIDLSFESEVNVQNMKSNYNILVPDYHKYIK
jgi:hypothetical protein